jgi:hypothetical protein
MMMPGDAEAVKGRKIDRTSMARVWVFASPYKTAIIGFLLSIIFASAVGLVPPFVFRAIVAVSGSWQCWPSVQPYSMHF